MKNSENEPSKHTPQDQSRTSALVSMINVQIKDNSHLKSSSVYNNSNMNSDSIVENGNLNTK